VRGTPTQHRRSTCHAEGIAHWTRDLDGDDVDPVAHRRPDVVQVCTIGRGRCAHEQRHPVDAYDDGARRRKSILAGDEGQAASRVIELHRHRAWYLDDAESRRRAEAGGEATVAGRHEHGCARSDAGEGRGVTPIVGMTRHGDPVGGQERGREHVAVRGELVPRTEERAAPVEPRIDQPDGVSARDA
jgi:hypothetical protein